MNVKVCQNYTRRELKQTLREMGLSRQPIFTIYTLRRLSIPNYNGLVILLDEIKDWCKNKKINLPDKTPLKLPWPRALDVIDFNKLLESKEAMKEVYRRCVELTPKPVINLTYLPWIYKNCT